LACTVAGGRPLATAITGTLFLTPIARISLTAGVPAASAVAGIADVLAPGARRPLTIAATEIASIIRARTVAHAIGPAVLLSHFCVVVADTLTMGGVVLPVAALAGQTVIDVHVAVDIDVVVAPVDVSAPIIARPGAERDARAEGEPGR
jgi:hypothetical protein